MKRKPIHPNVVSFFYKGLDFLVEGKKKKAKDICIKHPVVSCYMLVCFMAMV
jgi:hypothetical protein